MTTRLKQVALAFAITLIAAAGYFVGDQDVSLVSEAEQRSQPEVEIASVSERLWTISTLILPHPNQERSPTRRLL